MRKEKEKMANESSIQIRIALLESRAGRENGNIIKKLKRKLKAFQSKA